MIDYTTLLCVRRNRKLLYQKCNLSLFGVAYHDYSAKLSNNSFKIWILYKNDDEIDNLRYGRDVFTRHSLMIGTKSVTF